MADLVSIYEYIAKDSQRYALSVIDRLTKRTIQIGLFRFSGESVPEYRNQQIREVIEYSHRLIGPLAFYFAPATEAFDLGRGCTSPPGLEPSAKQTNKKYPGTVPAFWVI
jgi:hypothetical protein